MFDATLPLDKCPALILNADYRPLSYLPLSVLPWHEAIKAIFRESVVVVSEYNRVVRSPTIEMRLPAVLALKEYAPMKETPPFTRYNVYLRDQWRCQYCGDDFRTHELTFDHVIPRSRGGRTSWSNIVAACHCCNLRKGDRLPGEIGMHPLVSPRQPTFFELQSRARKYPPNFLHESWRDYLYWDTELVDQ